MIKRTLHGLQYSGVFGLNGALSVINNWSIQAASKGTF